MNSLLQNTRKGNVAVAIGIGIVIVARIEKNMNNTDVNAYINSVNEEYIIDVDLTIDVVERIIRHRKRAFTYSSELGLILLEDIVTEEMDDACEDLAELIGDTRALVASII